jgi:hypothetical protein
LLGLPCCRSRKAIILWCAAIVESHKAFGPVRRLLRPRGGTASPHPVEARLFARINAKVADEILRHLSFGFVFAARWAATALDRILGNCHPGRRTASALPLPSCQPFHRHDGLFNLFLLLTQLSQHFEDVHLGIEYLRPLARRGGARGLESHSKPAGNNPRRPGDFRLTSDRFPKPPSGR